MSAADRPIRFIRNKSSNALVPLNDAELLTYTPDQVQRAADEGSNLSEQVPHTTCDLERLVNEADAMIDYYLGSPTFR